MNYSSVLFSFFVISGCYVIYRLRFSPLRDIPGPWHTLIVPLWVVSHILRFRLCRAIEESFAKYGPVVRIAPNKVVFRDSQGAKTIYGAAHRFPKSNFYKALRMNGEDYTFTMSTHEAHAARRRVVAPHYANSNLFFFWPQFSLKARDLVQALFSTNKAVDCLTMFRHLMVDINFLTIFGVKGAAFDTWKSGREERLAIAIHDYPRCGALRESVPPWLWTIISHFPHPRWRRFCADGELLTSFAASHLRKYRATDEHPEHISHTLLGRLCVFRSLNPESEVFADREIIAETAAHLVAGTDTSTTTLTYLCWELGHRPDIVQHLREELGADRGTVDHDYAMLQSLPYLNAFIKEGLRLYGAAPSPLERIVPYSYRENTGRDFDVLGYRLPPGTNVATLAWSMHRDPTIFTSPLSFCPERWINTSKDADEDVRTPLNSGFMPFGIGPRACVGMNLAQMMHRLLIAVIVTNFDIVIPSETTEENMEMQDSFLISPASGRCGLIFRPRKTVGEV